MSSPFLTINDEPIYFSEDWATGIGGGLWSTGTAMAKYFEIHQDHVQQNMERCFGSSKLNVLELGSGNGFLSVCLLALLKHQIHKLVVTDMSDHLVLMRNTFAANPHLNQDQVTVMEHRWGDFGTQNSHVEDDFEASVHSGKYKFDLIVGSDVAYRTDLYDVLIDSLSKFSHAKTIILLGVTMKDTTPQFFHKLRDKGFHYTRLADHLLPLEFRGTTFGIFCIQRSI